jgi:hypothetical protein
MMPPPQSSGAVIVGLDEIGNLFGRSRWTIARWIRTQGFPAARLPDGKWFTTMGLIEAWTMERRALDPIVRQAEE